MAFDLRWDDLDPTILRQMLIGQWTIDDMVHLMEAANHLVQMKQQRVDVITEVGNQAHIPNGFLQSVRRIEHFVNIQPHVALNVVVSTNSIYRVFYRVGSILAPKAAGTFRFEDSVDKARKLILEDRLKSRPE